ncbi:radical SAM protein [Candidatus Woesearchaeota archaeon]|nr:radical SAM protein [Candidatus Woesearchaeota archaeon]
MNYGDKAIVDEIVSGFVESSRIDRMYSYCRSYEDILSKAMDVAASVKSKHIGDIASFYTCLYITNQCVNDCSYCGYRVSNKDLERITLTPDEVREEAIAIRESGVNNVILIGGTLPEHKYKDLILKSVKILKEENLNPWIEFEYLSSETLKEIRDLGVDHFILFQESYAPTIFDIHHNKNSIKSDFLRRFREPEKAIDLGYQNIGIGSLFGLWKEFSWEVNRLHQHTELLREQGANVCISVPTLKDAETIDLSRYQTLIGQILYDKEYQKIIESTETEKLCKTTVKPDILKSIVTSLRLSLPDVSIALSSRENEDLRNELFPMVDLIGTGGVPNPGGRTVYKHLHEKGDKQFSLDDKRTPKEVKAHLKKKGIQVVPKIW